MHKRDQNRTSRLVSTIFGIVLAALSLSSCESIYEDLAPCSHGVSLRFVYDYNMEYANAFPKKVDCLTLLIYDSGGNYVGMRTVTGPELQDETYRMQLDLEPGRYRFIAYGGMAWRRTFVRIRTAGTGQRRETGRDDSNDGCRPDNFRTRKAKVARPVLGKPNARNGRPVQQRDGGNDEEHE